MVQLGSSISTYFYELADQICKSEGAKSRAWVYDGIIAISRDSKIPYFWIIPEGWNTVSMAK